LEAPDGLEAWKLLELGLRPDLCIIDLLLPNMDGLELVQRIRFKAGMRNQKIIICSSTKERHRIAAANSLEISGYIGKPFSANKIQEEVRRVLQLPAPVSSNTASAEAIKPLETDAVKPRS
jgi:CheY-like chemotaxis protein